MAVATNDPSDHVLDGRTPQHNVCILPQRNERQKAFERNELLAHRRDRLGLDLKIGNIDRFTFSTTERPLAKQGHPVFCAVGATSRDQEQLADRNARDRVCRRCDEVASTNLDASWT